MTPTLRDQVRLYLSTNPHRTGRDVARHLSITVKRAVTVLWFLHERGEAASELAQRHRVGRPSLVWRMIKSSALHTRILTALDAPRMAWAVAKELGEHVAGVEAVCVEMARDGRVCLNNGFWERT